MSKSWLAMQFQTALGPNDKSGVCEHDNELLSSGCPGPPVFYGGFTIVYIRDCAGLSFERSRVQILARAEISDSLAPPANSSA